MNGLDEEQVSPQSFLYGCVLESGKDVVFNPEEDEFEHQLEIKTACVDPSTKDEMHMVEVEGQDLEGQKVKAVLASLKPSTLPSLCLGSFTITPPAVFRLKAGSGPIHLSGQHLVLMGGDQSFDEDDEDDEEVESFQASKKRPASTTAGKAQKKMKVDAEDTDDDDDDDEEDDDDDDDEESEEAESPVKAKATTSKAAAQNGKRAKPNTPSPKQPKNPNTKGDKTPKGKTPKSGNAPKQTPKTPLTITELKGKMMETVKKGTTLPKIQPKFENFLKNCYRVSDPKVIAELWTWRQMVKETK